MHITDLNRQAKWSKPGWQAQDAMSPFLVLSEDLLDVNANRYCYKNR